MSHKTNKLAGAALLGAAITIHAINHPEEGHSHSEIEPGRPMTTLVIPITGSQQQSSFSMLKNIRFTRSGFYDSSGGWVDYGRFASYSDVA